MIASMLNREQSITSSGYAWLVSEACQHRVSELVGANTDLLDRFDELVAAEVVAAFQHRGGTWSTRATGDVLLDVLDRAGLLDTPRLPVSGRDLALRAHAVARRIVPVDAWHA